MASPSNKRIKHDLSPFVISYEDGTVDRVGFSAPVPPSPSDPTTGVASKDVIIDSSTGVWARLYLPKLSDSDQPKLPLLVYFHGGAFILHSAATPIYHAHLTSLSAAARAVIVSVDYRLAPEHPIPTAYDDSLSALKWVAAHSTGAGPEEWLNLHTDFGRVFLAGDSSGGNISHHMAMKGAEARGGLRLRGVAMVNPSFWGSEEVGEMKEMVERLWEISSPDLEVDDPWLNPFGTGAPGLRGFGCEKALVCVAGMDWFRGRNLLYCEGLKGSGWEGTVEVFETEGEGHVFHLFEPKKETAKALMGKMVEFLNS
ncbi:putative carboxylesterase 5 [Acorus gramineus]|uniref:Carboxylesterase 5 n=1 Tax=Acorus gramineus TaxID=55184 RepID=A0AAV8ZZE1_ACOGR|nr:putative carboxylesterase 5 [Acorus gramineus]